MLFSCAVMMLRALNAVKCLSQSADDAGIIRTRFATPDNSGKRCARSPHHWRSSNSPGDAQPGYASISYLLVSFSTLFQWYTALCWCLGILFFFTPERLSGATVCNHSKGFFVLSNRLINIFGLIISGIIVRVSMAFGNCANVVILSRICFK